jgi:hypothetical protein
MEGFPEKSRSSVRFVNSWLSDSHAVVMDVNKTYSTALQVSGHIWVKFDAAVLRVNR